MDLYCLRKVTEVVKTIVLFTVLYVYIVLRIHCHITIVIIASGAITIHGNHSTIRSIDHSLFSIRPLILCNTTQASIIPELSVYNLIVTGFYSNISDGGAMSFVGDIDLLLSEITFIDNNSSLSGGALSIDRNSYRSRIHKCIFESCQSEGISSLYLC